MRSDKGRNSRESRDRNSAFFDLSNENYDEQQREPEISIFGETASKKPRNQYASEQADYYEPRKPVKKRRSKRRHPKRDRRVTLLVVLVYSVIGFFVCSLLITRYAYIIETDKALDALEADIAVLEAEVEKKQLEVSLKDDIALVQSKAKKELGMYYPRNEQIVYIDIDKAETIERDDIVDNEIIMTDDEQNTAQPSE